MTSRDASGLECQFMISLVMKGSVETDAFGE